MLNHFAWMVRAIRASKLDEDGKYAPLAKNIQEKGFIIRYFPIYGTIIYNFK